MTDQVQYWLRSSFTYFRPATHGIRCVFLDLKCWFWSNYYTNGYYLWLSSQMYFLVDKNMLRSFVGIVAHIESKTMTFWVQTSMWLGTYQYVTDSKVIRDCYRILRNVHFFQLSSCYLLKKLSYHYFDHVWPVN